MPSSYTSSLRFVLQATGENLNTWGVLNNNSMIALADYAIAGRAAFTLSGSKTLTTANGATDEARAAMLDITGGTGGTITVPAVEKLYTVRNAASGDVVVTTGGGATATIKPGEVVGVVCDAANVRRVQATDMGGVKLTGLGAPVAGTDAATKAYADALAFNEVSLPGQGAGTVGQYVRSDGAAASWQGVRIADVEGLNAALAAQNTAISAGDAATQLAARNLAIAFAVAL